MMERKMSKIEVRREEMESVTLAMVAIVDALPGEGEGLLFLLVGSLMIDDTGVLVLLKENSGNKSRGFPLAKA